MGRVGRQKKRKKRKKQKGPLQAATRDRYDLYEASVQEPEAEVDLIDQVWREQRDRQATTLREDFSGTALNCIEWVRRRPQNRAIGVDLDPEVMGRAQERIARRSTPEEAQRIELLEEDVLKVRTEPMDSVLAFNFSYFIFKTRDLLRRYFKRVHESLVEDGLFLLDAYGGSDSLLETEEPRKVDDFTYVWETESYSPVTAHVLTHISFRFKDGSKMNRAFSYDWRLWSLPEIQEVLHEAGFQRTIVYWEGSDEDGEGNGEWSVTERGDADEGWVAYLVACK